MWTNWSFIIQKTLITNENCLNLNPNQFIGWWCDKYLESEQSFTEDIKSTLTVSVKENLTENKRVDNNKINK